MSFTVYDGLYAYAKRANSGLYLGCKTAIFNDPNNQIYTPKGRITKVRQYESGKAGSYNKNTGWLQGYGASKGVQWIDYYAPYDRAKNLSVDALDEMQSYANGMEPSIDLLNADFFNNFMPSEIDATNVAQFYSKIPSTNKHVNTESGYGTDVDNVLSTLISLQNKIFNSGYAGKIVLFVRSAVSTNMQSAFIKNYGLASGAILTKTMSVNIDTGLGELAGDDKGVLSLDTEVQMFNNFIVIPMPDDRMYTMITLLDGYSSGQEDGGYIPDYDDDNFAQIDLLAIPIVAAFTNVRYLVDNYLVPGSMVGGGSVASQLKRLDSLKEDRKNMFGNIMIGQAGINQKANAFEYDVRVVYGGDLFDNRARNCFAITGVVGDQTVDSITVTGTGGATTISTDGGTLQMLAAVLPVTATDKTVTWSVVPGTGTASISTTGILTATTDGTVTVKATANDGTAVYGELVVTISNQT